MSDRERESVTGRVGTSSQIDCNLHKSEDDDGSRAVFGDVDCFRSQG